MNITIAMLCLVLSDFEDKFESGGVEEEGEGVEDK